MSKNLHNGLNPTDVAQPQNAGKKFRYTIQCQRLQGCFRHIFNVQVGRTDLRDAAERGDVEAVSWLLATLVDINSRTEVRVILTLQKIIKTLLFTGR